MSSRSAKEWIAFMLEMPEKEYGLLEYHANEFGRQAARAR